MGQKWQTIKYSDCNGFWGGIYLGAEYKSFRMEVKIQRARNFGEFAHINH